MPRTTPNPAAEGFFSTLRRERPLALLLFLVTVLYAFLNCVRHWHFWTAGYDLGIFDQATWNLSRGRAPACTVNPFPNIFGDHFEPVLILLAPLYWIVNDVQALFFAQSFAAALGALVLFRYCERKLGTKAAYAWTTAYCFFWGIQSLLAYDFHPEGMAVPMVAFAIRSIDERKWAGTFAALLLLMTVKEDQTLLAVFFGIYLILLRQWRPGLAAAVLGAGGFILEVGFLVPYFGQRPYSHWIYPDFGKTAWESCLNVLRHPFWVPEIWFSNGEKIMTMACAFLACAGTVFFSPLLVLTIPIFAERMLSCQEPAWSMGYHYSGTLGPILMMGGVDGLYRLAGRFKDRGRRERFIRTVSMAVMVLNVLSVFAFPTKDLFRWKFYRFDPSQRVGAAALRSVPQDVVVLAQDCIVPHLSHRKAIYDLQPDNIGMDCDYYVICNKLRSWPFPDNEAVSQEAQRRLENGYAKVFEGEGWLVLRKNIPAKP